MLIEWMKRYSFTDEPDEMGRWARLGVVNRLTFCLISKVKDKYCTDMYIPTRLSDSPHEVQVFDNFEDAKKFACDKLVEFNNKLNKMCKKV